MYLMLQHNIKKILIFFNSKTKYNVFKHCAYLRSMPMSMYKLLNYTPGSVTRKMRFVRRIIKLKICYSQEPKKL